jgi:hypothetical protein
MRPNAPSAARIPAAIISVVKRAPRAAGPEHLPFSISNAEGRHVVAQRQRVVEPHFSKKPPAKIIA